MRTKRVAYLDKIAPCVVYGKCAFAQYPIFGGQVSIFLRFLYEKKNKTKNTKAKQNKKAAIIYFFIFLFISCVWLIFFFFSFLLLSLFFLLPLLLMATFFFLLSKKASNCPGKFSSSVALVALVALTSPAVIPNKLIFF